MYNITLTYNDMEALRTILLDDIESDGYDIPDYADVDLMEKFTHRARVLKQVIQLLSCTPNELRTLGDISK
tara:strand:+ start:197 stop:409 length:213 start_codon:yes stop_codon:yes gene_type:complete